MDEDEDAFLYGDGDESTNTGNGVTDAAANENAKQQPSTDQIGQPEQTEDAEDDEEEDEEDDEEEEDSDSDLEIIVDSSAVDAKPPPGYNARPLAPYNKSYQAQKAAGNAAAAAAISTEYTPLTRPGQSNAVVESAGGVPNTTASEAKPLTGHVELTLAQAQALQQQQEAQSQLPEGPPPPAPITAPRIDLDPSGQALMLPPEVAGGEPGPLIYHLDPSEMEEKPWRRPGADLSDWFNYGLNEESWRAWGEKKTSIRQERIEMEKDGGHSNRERGDATNEQQYQDNSMMQQQQMQQYGVPPQQAQMMQAIMAGSGMNMPMDQMMAFMGMQPGGGGFGMGQSNPMMGMMGMNNPMGMMGFQYGGGMMQNNHNMQQNQGYEGGNGANGYQDDNGNDEAEYEPTDDIGTSSNDFTANAAQASSSTNGGENSGVNASKQLLPNKPLPVGEIPTGPASDRSKSPLPQHVPTGPKNAGRRYNDRDTGAGMADALDYGAGGGLREDGEGRRSSAGPKSPIRTRDSSAGWDNDIPTGPRSDRERDHARRRTAKRTDDDTPRSSRHDDDHDSETTGDGRHRTHSSRSARDSRRTDRRRGEPEGGDDREEEESSKSRSSKSRSYARSERRAGRDAPEEDSHSSSRRSRKRTTTDDGDLLSPPREPRRRRG